MKIPLVREWGSWAVSGLACVIALGLGIIKLPPDWSAEYVWTTVLTIIGMFFLINAKNPLNSLIRSRWRNREQLLWLIFFVSAGLACLIPFLKSGSGRFAIFLFLILSYSFLLWKDKEHRIVTELNGFAILTLTAPVVYFVLTGHLSLKLYLAVTLFFAAGVIKVRVRIRKNMFYRITMILYCIAVVLIYYLMNVNILILLPLAENVASALWLRDERLKTTGNIELTKGILFVILMIYFWS